MANTFNDNNAAPACGVKTCAAMPAFAPKSLVKDLDALELALTRLTAEGRKWSPDEANAAIKKRRDAARKDPSDANLAKISEESEAELRKRYEDTRTSITQIYYEKQKEGISLVRKLSEVFTSAIDAEMARIQNTQRTTCERYGVEHSPDTDPLLKSLRRLRDGVNAALSSPTGIDPRLIKKRLGALKPAGLF